MLSHRPRAFTEKVNKGGTTLYRARFSGFDEADAGQNACKALKRERLQLLRDSES